VVYFPYLPEIRATYLSIQSLVGRISFSGLLFLLPLVNDSNEIAGFLHTCLLVAMLGIAALATVS